ncbi:MAG: hypothetical protein ACI837_001401 [Crocinitomicaceae bacterium]|jgi:hypothetical protein
MKKRITRLSTLTFASISIVLIFMMSSCGKYAGDVDANYVGTWISDTLTSLSTGGDEYQYIIINGEENSEYGYRCGVDCGGCGCIINVLGNAKINKKKTKLLIGTTSNTTPLSIDEQPTIINGNWRMKIANRYYCRQ